MSFLLNLLCFAKKCNVPYIIGGDFNIIRFSSEKNKGGIHKHSGIFNSIINSFGLIDLHLSGGKYTWSNNQSPPTLERLDRLLMDKSWENLFPSVVFFKLPREMSDHNPTILTDNISISLPKINFRFKLSWLKHPEYLSRVQEIWNSPCHAESAFDRIQLKLKKFKQHFKGWGFNNQGIERKIKQQLNEELLILEQIEEQAFLSLEQVQKKVQIQSTLLKMLEDEEMY